MTEDSPLRAELRDDLRGDPTDVGIQRAAEALATGDRDTRLLALQVLDRAGAALPAEAVVPGLTDVDAGIRARAAELAGRTADAAVVEPLAERIRQDPDDVVTGASLRALATLVASLVELPTEALDTVVGAVGSLDAVRRERHAEALVRIADAIPDTRLSRYTVDERFEQREGARALLGDRREMAAATPDVGRDPAPRTDLDQPAIDLAGMTGDLTAVATEPASVVLPDLYAAFRRQPRDERRAAVETLAVLPEQEVDAWLVGRARVADGPELSDLAHLHAQLRLAGLLSALADRVLDLTEDEVRSDVLRALRVDDGLWGRIERGRTSARSDERQDALRLAMAVDPGRFDSVLAALRDDVASVRLAGVAEAVGLLGRSEVTDTLLAVLEGDTSAEVRLAATRALDGADRTARVAAARSALLGADPAVRAAAVDLLRDRGADEITLLARALDDPDDGVGGAAAVMLAQRHAPDSMAVLWRALRDASGDRRDALMDAFRHLDPEAVFGPARQAVDSRDPEERALGLALITMADVPAPGLLELLHEALVDPDAGVRLAALRALRGHTAALDLEVVGARARDPEPAVRTLALQLLENTGDDRALPYLLDAARDPTDDVRRSARDAILRRRSRTLARSLVDALRVPVHRRAARELLVELGDAAVDTLLGALTTADEGVRHEIGDTLRGGGHEARIVATLTDRRPDVRRQAIDALGAMEAVDAVGDIVQRLSDPDPGVRRAAARVLGELGDQRALEPLKRALVSDPDLEIVAVVEASLRQLTATDAMPTEVVDVRRSDPTGQGEDETT